MTVAFVLGGGGNLGAVQIGMLRALLDAGIRPDLVVGCSVGALNGAAFAADPTPACLDRLEALWTGLPARGVLPAGWVSVTVALARPGEAIHPIGPLRAVVEDFLPVRTFAELAVPFQCVATDLADAAPAWFDRGPLSTPCSPRPPSPPCTRPSKSTAAGTSTAPCSTTCPSGGRPPSAPTASTC